MNTYILWIERDCVKWFHIEREGTKERVLHRREIRHHTSHAPENLKNTDKFFHKVAESIQGADEILLVGPSLGKEHFRDYLENHRGLGLAGKVVGILTLGPHTDNQILAQSREFFRYYDVFGESPSSDKPRKAGTERTGTTTSPVDT